MRPFHYLVIASLAPVLADCSIHPLVDDVTRETTSDIVRHIRCEARQAVLDHDIRSANAPAGTNTTLAIAYEFTFTITENNNAKTDVTAEIPFLTKGSGFTLLANADSEQLRFSKRNFRILDTFDELRNADYCSPKRLENNLTYPIAGEIGIYEVVTTFAQLSRVAELKKPLPFSSQPKQGPAEPLNKVVFRFADTLTFTTTLSGGVTPTLTLSPLTNRFRVTKVNQKLGLEPGLDPGSELKALGTGLNVRRQDVHKVVIAMAGVPKTIDLRRRNDNIRPPLSPNSITSTTEYQLQATAKERALFELDRQRMLALQQQSPNLLLGGP